MKTTETRHTVQTTLSINVELLNTLRLLANINEMHVSDYINQCALDKCRQEQHGTIIYQTNRQWKPTRKIQIRLNRFVWEFLEMRALNKSRFINDAINERYYPSEP